ncbi:hypothetical protein ACLK19_25435 [Escherichia coli]
MLIAKNEEHEAERVAGELMAHQFVNEPQFRITLFFIAATISRACSRRC